jgi:hypothetical protein
LHNIYFGRRFTALATPEHERRRVLEFAAEGIYR